MAKQGGIPGGIGNNHVKPVKGKDKHASKHHHQRNAHHGMHQSFAVDKHDGGDGESRSHEEMYCKPDGDADDY